MPPVTRGRSREANRRNETNTDVSVLSVSERLRIMGKPSRRKLSMQQPRRFEGKVMHSHDRYTTFAQSPRLVDSSGREYKFPEGATTFRDHHETEPGFIFDMAVRVPPHTKRPAYEWLNSAGINETERMRMRPVQFPSVGSVINVCLPRQTMTQVATLRIHHIHADPGVTSSAAVLVSVSERTNPDWWTAFCDTTRG